MPLFLPLFSRAFRLTSAPRCLSAVQRGIPNRRLTSLDANQVSGEASNICWMARTSASSESFGGGSEGCFAAEQSSPTVMVRRTAACLLLPAHSVATSASDNLRPRSPRSTLSKATRPIASASDQTMPLFRVSASFWSPLLFQGHGQTCFVARSGFFFERARRMSEQDALHAFPEQRFVDREIVGTGRQSFVMRVWDTSLQRDAALKLPIRHNWPGDDAVLQGVADKHGLNPAELVAFLNEEDRSRYTPLREARLLALVDHPNVAQVLEVGVFDGAVAVVLRYLEGGTLAERDLGRCSLEELVDIALQIGRGLVAIHDAGIIHRDLKPHNILFDVDGRVRIADLGLACLTTDAEALAERVGTPHYWAPDMVTEGHRDQRDDLYAFCILVYEMLNGWSPFASVEHRKRGDISRSREGVPHNLHVALARGLAPEAADRWPSMNPLLRKIEGALKEPSPKLEPARPSRRWVWAAAVAALPGCIAAALYLFGTGTAEADECAEVARELEWNGQIRSELQGAFDSRAPGDALGGWANRWQQVRMHECARGDSASPCTSGMRERFEATVAALRNGELRAGLDFATVIADLPAPERCLDEPHDLASSRGGLLELRDVDMQVEALVNLGDLEVARARLLDYAELAAAVHSQHGIARTIYFNGVVARLEGAFDVATTKLQTAYQMSAKINAPVFSAECLLQLTAVAGAQRNQVAADAYALVARDLFLRSAPDRAAELDQVHGLALVAAAQDADDRHRGVELLRAAMEAREQQVSHGGSSELLSRAHEDYAVGLLAVGRTSEALEYLDLALQMHQKNFGHSTSRTREIWKHEFRALVESGQSPEAEKLWRAILIDAAEKTPEQLIDDVLWMARIYAEAKEPERAEVVRLVGRVKAAELELDVTRLDEWRAAKVDVPPLP